MIVRQGHVGNRDKGRKEEPETRISIPLALYTCLDNKKK
jgi:hypothetical protein